MATKGFVPTLEDFQEADKMLQEQRKDNVTAKGYVPSSDDFLEAEKLLKDQMSGKAKPEEPLQGKKDNLLDALVNQALGVVRGGLSTAYGVPATLRGLYQSVNQLYDSDYSMLRPLDYMGYGLSKGVRKLQNIPANVNEAMYKLGIAPEFVKDSSDIRPGELPWYKGMEEQATDADRFAANIGELAPFGMIAAATGGLGGALLGGATKSAAENEPITQGMTEFAIPYGVGKFAKNTYDIGKRSMVDLPPLEMYEKKLKDAGLSEKEAKLALEDYKSSLESRGLPLSPGKLEYRKSQKEAAISGLKPLAETPFEDTSVPPTPRSEEGIIERANQNFEQAKDVLSQYLGKGKAHHRVLFEEPVKDLNAIGEDIREKGYIPIENQLKEKEVTFKSDPDAAKIYEEINDLVRDEYMGSKDVKDTISALTESGNTGSIRGDNLLRMYQETKALQAKEEGLSFHASEAEKFKHRQRAEKLQRLMVRQKSLLDEMLGESGQEKLAETDARWANEIGPALRTKFYAKLRGGQGEFKNTAALVEGPHPGQEIFRDLIKKNPKSNKALLGQELASQPEKAMEMTEVQQEYAAQDPKLLELSKQLKQAHEVKKKAPLEASRVKAERERIETVFKESKELQQKALKAREDINRFESELKEIKEAIPELENRIKNKNLSQEAKQAANEELKRLKERHEQKIKDRVKLYQRLGVSLGVAGLELGFGGDVGNVQHVINRLVRIE